MKSSLNIIKALCLGLCLSSVAAQGRTIPAGYQLVAHPYEPNGDLRKVFENSTVPESTTVHVRNKQSNSWEVSVFLSGVWAPNLSIDRGESFWVNAPVPFDFVAGQTPTSAIIQLPLPSDQFCYIGATDPSQQDFDDVLGTNTRDGTIMYRYQGNQFYPFVRVGGNWQRLFAATGTNIPPRLEVGEGAVVYQPSAPMLLLADSAQSPANVYLRFQNPVDNSIVKQPGKFEIDGGTVRITSISLHENDRTVVLHTPTSFVDGSTHTVRLSGVRDASSGGTIGHTVRTFTYDAACDRAPGVPRPGFNRCSFSLNWPLTPSNGTANATQFAVSGNHAVWMDSATGSPQLFAIDIASVPGANLIAIPNSGNLTEFDLFTSPLDPADSILFGAGSGNNLSAWSVNANQSFSPFNATHFFNQSSPAGNEGFDGMVWAENGDIWFMDRTTEASGGTPTRISTSPTNETNPRIHDTAIVWEDTENRTIQYVPAPGNTPITVDHLGANPDIFGDWIVYEKTVSFPLSDCPWPDQTQIWAYNIATQQAPMPISSAPDWGNGQYHSPRLTKDFVVFLADYPGDTKTVVGIYPVGAFGLSGVEMKEITDNGDRKGSVDAWQAPGSNQVWALYRALSTGGAELSLVEY
jgi:hypothetical protein